MPAGDAVAGDRVVGGGGRADADRVDPADQAGELRPRLGTVLPGDRLGTLRARVDDGDEAGGRVAGVLVGMEAADMSGADDGAANGIRHRNRRLV